MFTLQVNHKQHKRNNDQSQMTIIVVLRSCLASSFIANLSLKTCQTKKEKEKGNSLEKEYVFLTSAFHFCSEFGFWFSQFGFHNVVKSSREITFKAVLESRPTLCFPDTAAFTMLAQFLTLFIMLTSPSNEEFRYGEYSTTTALQNPASSLPT